MIGQLLGHYRIVEKIGAGGMGEVYRAHDEKLERDVALKVLPVGMLADEAARKRFRKEALALAKLNHPNIETIYEFATQEGVDFLAMELISGLTLGQKLNNGPLLDSEILKLGAQIAEGLNTAHEQGVVHCDLKPGNVMVTSNGQAKVLDFGLAKFFHISKDSLSTESLIETQAAGTLPYMSPEQVRGERVDARTDIYAAGAVLYEMSTGQRPFPETQAPRLIDAILHQEPNRPRDINRRVTPGLENVVLKALDKSPERRYQSAKELAVDLVRLSSSALPVLRPRLKKRKFWLFAAATTILVAVVALAIITVRYFEGRHKAELIAHPANPNSAAGKRLALLPFKLEDDQASLGYVADGLVESLYLGLSQLSDLNVASSKAVSNSNLSQSLDKLARELGVNFVVTGHVSSKQQSLRVIVTLQDVADAQPFWAREFSGKQSELLLIQNQVYDGLLEALGIKETEDERFRAVMGPAVSFAAYDLYLKGRERMSPRQAEPAPEEAIHFYKEALKRAGNFDLAYIGLADANLLLYALKKNKLFLQRAVDAARRAVQLNVDTSPSAHSVLGSAYIASGNYAQAVPEFKRAVSLAPSSDEAYRRLGDAYVAAGNFPRATEAFEKAVFLNPYYWANQNALGRTYFQSGNYLKALEEFQQVIALQPDNDAGYENVGGAYLRQGQYQEAVPYFQKALRIKPHYSTYSNLGTSYFFLKQYLNAVEQFEKAVAMDRADTTLMANMADSYRELGRPERARAAYQRAIQLGTEELKTNPQNSDVMAQIALCYANLGDAQQADGFIKKARAIDKSNVNYIYEEAEIYALLGKSKEALNALRESLDKHYPAQFAAEDSALNSIRNNPEYRQLIYKYSEKPAVPQVAAH